MGKIEGLEYVVDDIGLRTSIHDAVDAMGNNPAKMVTMAALVRLGEERSPIYPCTSQELGLYINRLQGDVAEDEGWLLMGSTTRTPFEYCETPMEPAGLVRRGSKISDHSCRGGRPADTYSATDKGAKAGLALAGGFMNWRLGNDVSLADTLGAVSGGVTGLRRYSVTRRLAMLARLVDHPSVHVSMDDLSPTGRPLEAQRAVVRQLAEAGILLLDDRAYKPDQRKINILARPEGAPMPGHLEESQLVLEVLREYFEAGSCEHTVGDILERATELHPGADRAVLWQVIRRQFTGKIWRFMDLENSIGKPWMRKKGVEIASGYFGPIASLIGVYRDLLYSAKRRAAARERAMEIIGNNAAVAFLMRAAREDSAHAGDKNTSRERFNEVISSVLTDGMSVRDLYGAFTDATGSIMKYASFKRRLCSSGAFELRQYADVGLGRVAVGIVRSATKRNEPKVPAVVGDGLATGDDTPKDAVTSEPASHATPDNPPESRPNPPYPLDESYALSGKGKRWQIDAGCARSDPELFSVDTNKADHDSVKAVCARCPVKGDCLLWALVSSERRMIAGGYTPIERSEFGGQVIKWLEGSGPKHARF